MRLATTLHPYYSTTWLSKAQAQAFCREQGFPGIRITGTWCKQHDIEVASTGHIRLLSLQSYIDARRWQAEQAERDLRGA